MRLQVELALCALQGSDMLEQQALWQQRQTASSRTSLAAMLRGCHLPCNAGWAPAAAGHQAFDPEEVHALHEHHMLRRLSYCSGCRLQDINRGRDTMCCLSVLHVVHGHRHPLHRRLSASSS